MKKSLPGVVLFLALVGSAHAQFAQTAANSARSQTIIPRAVGNTLLVQCDYNGPPPQGAAISDSIGTLYTLLVLSMLVHLARNLFPYLLR
jgi:hypothetical protein